MNVVVFESTSLAFASPAGCAGSLRGAVMRQSRLLLHPPRQPCRRGLTCRLATLPRGRDYIAWPVPPSLAILSGFPAADRRFSSAPPRRLASSANGEYSLFRYHQCPVKSNLFALAKRRSGRTIKGGQTAISWIQFRQASARAMRNWQRRQGPEMNRANPVRAPQEDSMRRHSRCAGS